MFGIEGNGFIVSICVTLLLIGTVTYYCNSRLSAMEKALVKQNQVLGDFITNVRTSLVSTDSQQQQTGGAAEEAIVAARQHYASSNPVGLITVSEDSDENNDDDDNDDSDSSLDCGSILSSENHDNDSINNDNDKCYNDICEYDTSNIEKRIDFGIQSIASKLSQADTSTFIINLSTNNDTEHTNTTLFETMNTSPVTKENKDITVIEQDDINERPLTPPIVKTIKLGDINNEEELEQATSRGSLGTSSEISSIHNDTSTNISVSSNHANDSINLHKMKVQQLKEIAISQGIVSEETVKKIKKSELIKILKDSKL